MAQESHWTFVSNHLQVMVCLARDPDLSLRQVSQTIGITERAVQRIVTDLEQAGYIERRKEGRRNHYTIHAQVPLRHPMERHLCIGDLLSLIVGADWTAR